MIRRVLAVLAVTLVTGACASGPGDQPAQVADNYPEPVFSAERLLPADFVSPTEVNDPWQGMNRRIYAFNYRFDYYVFLPVVRGYRAVVPQVARRGVGNFFENFRDMRSAVNSVLQLNPEKFFQSTGRVLLNSTVGLFGLIDVATMADIPKPDEDFGQTLGYWGVDQGPYLVIPLLGPSNLRDGVGMLPDFYMQTVFQDELLAKPLRATVFLFDSIDTRYDTSFRYYETGSAFEYDMVRFLWSTKRELDVAK